MVHGLMPNGLSVSEVVAKVRTPSPIGFTRHMEEELGVLGFSQWKSFQKELCILPHANIAFIFHFAHETYLFARRVKMIIVFEVQMADSLERLQLS